MRRSAMAASITLLFATQVWAANPSPMNSPPVPGAQRRVLAPLSAEPEAAALQIATPAPMFSYIGADGRWHRSDELLSRGPLLVLFGANDTDLVTVQRLAPAFEELGVRPVAVLGLTTRGTSQLTRRLGISIALVSDPMSAIAGLYHRLEPTTGRHAPAYFVIDSHHTLRAMGLGPLPPTELLVATTARSLGRPLPSALFTSSDER